jgi:hypothetical protein
MDKLTKDTFFLISEKLNFHDLLSFCQISKFDKEEFWLNKIRREFPEYSFETKKKQNKYIQDYIGQE